MAAVLAALPLETRDTDRDAITLQARYAFTTGDAAGLVALWRRAGPNWRFATLTARADLYSVGAAFLVLRQPEQARPLLELNRDRLVDALKQAPENAVKWSDLALVYALLGEAKDARAAKAQAERLAKLDALDTPLLASVEAWLGNKQGSLDELARLLRTAPATSLTNVHVLRHDLLWWPLQGDPRFEALLNDPKNNAPLF